MVFGRVSGDSAAAYLLQQASSADRAAGRLGAVAGHLLETRVRIDPGQNKVNLEFSWDGKSASSGVSPGPAPQQTSASTQPSAGAPAQAQAGEKAAAGAEESKSGGADREYTAAEVAKHNKAGDVWVVIDGQVLDVTKVSGTLRLRGGGFLILAHAVPAGSPGGREGDFAICGPRCDGGV